jgi:hypothetical protein
LLLLDCDHQLVLRHPNGGSKPTETETGKTYMVSYWLEKNKPQFLGEQFPGLEGVDDQVEVFVGGRCPQLHFGRRPFKVVFLKMIFPSFFAIKTSYLLFLVANNDRTSVCRLFRSISSRSSHIAL